MKQATISTLMIAIISMMTPISSHALESIRVGAVLSTTGPAAFLGEPELKTVELYIKKINAEGGVLGRNLELISYDDGSDANKANSFTKRLIESDKVDFIVGGTTTGSSLSMMPLIEKAGIPFVSLAGAVAIVEPVHKWIFKISHTDRMAAEKVFEDAKKRGFTKMALISETSGFGQSGHKEALAAAKKIGIEILVDETYGQKDTDVTPQLTRIKMNPAIQAVLVFGIGQGPTTVTKNYRQLGLKAPIYQSHGVASSEFARLVGAAGEGVRLPSPALLVVGELPNSDKRKPILSAYKAAYEQQYKEDASTFGGYAYDALMFLVNGIKVANSTDKELVRTAIEKTNGYISTAGIVHMSATDHLGLDSSAFQMVEIKNGKFQIAK
ncbi:MAG: ABC transporter substrate-binding protein [Rhodoferax sp.]|uniref:ABC transporter substrate-binding protein n=1 Tax=Rhodoferax sp. TaxID=50421 RepID=UPI0030192D38